jgi:hypothetical protein
MAVQRFAVDANELAGKRALVTGGTHGMGEAIVRRLVARRRRQGLRPPPGRSILVSHRSS